MSVDFYQKYLKYKQKYNQLKTQLGGVFEFVPMCHSLDVKCIDKLNEEFTKNFNSKTQIAYPLFLKNKYDLPAQSNLLTTYSLLKLLRDFEILKPEHPDKVEELSSNIHRYLKSLLSNFLPITEALLNNPGATDLNLNLICTDLFKKENAVFLTNELTGLFEIFSKSEFNGYDYPYQLVICAWSKGLGDNSFDNVNKICNFLDENNLSQLQCIITKLIIDKPGNYEKIILHALKPKIFLWFLENKSSEFNSHILQVLQKKFDIDRTSITSTISYQYIDIIRLHLTQLIIGGRTLVPIPNKFSGQHYCSYSDFSSEPFISELFDKITLDFVQLLFNGQLDKIFCLTNFSNPDKNFILFDGENVLFKMRNSVEVIDKSKNVFKSSEYREEQYEKFFADLFFYNQNYIYLTFFEGATNIWEPNIISSYPAGSMETYFIYSTCENNITFNEPIVNPFSRNLFCTEQPKNLRTLPCQTIFGKNENDDYMLFLFYWILKLCGNEPKVISADKYRWSKLTIPRHRIELKVEGGNYSNIIINNNDLTNTDLVNMMNRLGHRSSFNGGKDNKGFVIKDKEYNLFTETRSRTGLITQSDVNDFINFGIKSNGSFNELNPTFLFTENAKGTVKSLIKNFLNYYQTGNDYKLKVDRFFVKLNI